MPPRPVGRLVVVLLALLLLFLVPPTCLQAEDGEQLVLSIGVYDNSPKVFRDAQGQPRGIFIDILEDIAQREGWQLNFVYGTWEEGLERLSRRVIDIMPDVAYGSERAKVFAFNRQPVLSSWSQVYARPGSGIKSLLELDGKKIATLKGSLQEESFLRLSESFDIKVQLYGVRDFKTAFAMVNIGEADAAISNSFFGFANARTHHLEDTAVVFSPSKLHFAARRDFPQHLLDAIDRHLLRMKEDRESVYYASLKRWMAEEISFTLPTWAKVVGSGILAFLLLSLTGSILLKRQVNRRTAELRQANEEMEARIRERTAQLEAINREQTSIFETASTGIVLMRQRTVVHCNRKFEEIFGYQPGEMNGKPTRVWYPDEESYLLGGAPVYEQMGRGETHRRHQQMIRKDGTLFWARISCRAFDPGSPLTGAVAIIEDISEEREREEQLRQAMERAQAADRLKSAFLATMSHELRTPLNSIIGFTGIMLQGLTGPLNPEQHKQMTMVQASSRHLLSLINDVLDISKIEAGQLSLECKPFDLRLSLEKSLRLVAPLAEKKGLTLSTELPDLDYHITGDQRRVEQVVINLLNNAIKFTEQGWVKLSAEGDGDGLLLHLADSGIGIAAEDLPRLFQPFHQLDSGLARKREGTGLGLSICRKLLDMMGGTIAVHSLPGEGSTFTIRLPRQAREANNEH